MSLRLVYRILVGWYKYGREALELYIYLEFFPSRPLGDRTIHVQWNPKRRYFGAEFKAELVGTYYQMDLDGPGQWAKECRPKFLFRHPVYQIRCLARANTKT